jgi:hypothetical protein
MIVGIGLGQQQTINFSAPPPSSVGSVSYSVTGNPGTGSAYYWVVARYVSGNASPKSVRAINIPAPLNNSQYVTVRWTPVTVQPPNTTGSYDVLKTITSTIPGGNCACALATGVSGTSYNDKGGALGAYVVQTEGTAKGTITLNNSGATPEFVFVPPIPLSNFVPYSGAVKDVDLGNNSLTTNNLTVNGTCTGCGGATSTGGSVDTVTVSGGYGIAGGFETCTTVPTAGAAAPLTASVVAGGLLYVNGDQGTISGCGDGTSIYTVTSSLGGVVSAVTITGGTNYVLGGPCSTTVTGGSGDGNLTLNITGVGGDGNLTLTPTSVTGVGDSTITVTTYYTKIQ